MEPSGGHCTRVTGRLSNKLTAEKAHVIAPSFLWDLPTYKAAILFYLLMQMEGKFINHLKPPIKEICPDYQF